MRRGAVSFVTVLHALLGQIPTGMQEQSRGGQLGPKSRIPGRDEQFLGCGGRNVSAHDVLVSHLLRGA